MAADSVGFFDNGVHAQLGDLVNECVLVAFPVLHHCGQQRENSSYCALDKCNERGLKISQALRDFYRGLSGACTR